LPLEIVMANASHIKLPEAFTNYLEQHYYAQVTERSRLEAVIHDPDFLRNPLEHVALFSDHGILHGRDIADKIIQIIQQINGLLILRRSALRLEFMLGYGAMLDYLHDIGMKNFSAFGRAMHPEFFEQTAFSWLVAAAPEVQQLTLDVIDTVRALRCADALRQRGTTFTTSAGYQVFVSDVHRLSLSALRQIQERSPQTANTFAQSLLMRLSQQLNQANHPIATLQQDQVELIERLTIHSDEPRRRT
jgi:hypothetical protein